MKVKPRGIEIPLIILLIVLSVFVVGALGLVVVRLGRSGVFEQQTVAQTDVVTTRRAASIITQGTTTVTEAETTTAKPEETEAETEKETEKETETTAPETTKPEETTTAETKPAETKTEKSDTTKKTEKTEKTEKTDKKTDTSKSEEKGGKTTETTAAKNEDKDPVSLYQNYLKDELVPKYGLAAASEEKRAEDIHGLSSVLIRDFSNSGDLEMLVVRLEKFNQYYASYPIFELYGIQDGKVAKLSDAVYQEPMSEWNLRSEGSNVYICGKQFDVNAPEEKLRINQIDVDITKHKITIVRDSYTIGDPNGPAQSFTDDALWVTEIYNRLAEADRGNEGRLYTLTDYTGLRDWIK